MGISGNLIVGGFRTIPNDGFSTQGFLYNLSTSSFTPINAPRGRADGSQWRLQRLCGGAMGPL